MLCALLSAASGLTLRPCGRPTTRRALLAGSLCAAVLPAFAEDAPVPAAPTRMYQNGLVVPELASEPTAAPVAAAPTLAEPDEITRAARSRTEPQTEPRTRALNRASGWRLTFLLARGPQVLCADAEDQGMHVRRVRDREGRVHQLQRRRGLCDRAWAATADPWHPCREPQQRPAVLTCSHRVAQPCCRRAAAVPQPCGSRTGRTRGAACPGLERHLLWAVRTSLALTAYRGNTGDQTPLKLAAKCRDARVPYTFPFSDFLATQKKQKEAAAAAGGGFALPSLPKLPF